ncbi:hypothetical protein C8039_11635 [Halogeometricum sp. wsp3]|nr:hypothetical protein C8039_11635 [Halogeometricum sp. wsp3]
MFLFDRDCRYTVAGGDEIRPGLTPLISRTSQPHDLFSEATPRSRALCREALDGHSLVRPSLGASTSGSRRPVRDDNGDVISGLAVSEDVTARSERERTLERQNERLNEFAGVVCSRPPKSAQRRSGTTQLARKEHDSEHLDAWPRHIERSDS